MSWDESAGWPEESDWIEPDTADVLNRSAWVGPELVRMVEGYLPQRRDGFTQQARATVHGRDTGARFDLRVVDSKTLEVRANRWGVVSVPHIPEGAPGNSMGMTWQLHGPGGLAFPQLWTVGEIAASIVVASVKWEQSGRPGPLRFEWGRRPSI